MKTTLLFSTFTAALCMTAASPSYAADRTISSDYALTADETVDGVLTIEAGAAVLKKDAKDRAAELKRIESVAAAFEKNYCKLLDRIEALGAKVILRTPTPYDEFTKGPTADGKMRVNAKAGRNDAQRRIAG